MKSKKQIEYYLRERQKDLVETTAYFKEFDNHEDMQHMEILEAEISLLKFILLD